MLHVLYVRMRAVSEVMIIAHMTRKKAKSSAIAESTKRPILLPIESSYATSY